MSYKLGVTHKIVHRGIRVQHKNVAGEKTGGTARKACIDKKSASSSKERQRQNANDTRKDRGAMRIDGDWTWPPG